MHTTNYYDTFLSVADDCPARSAALPPQKGDAKTVASLQFELISAHPYRYTSDEILFRVFASRNQVAGARWAEEQEQFFSKGQPCLRCSPLAKRYGWGFHFDAAGKVAVYAMESEEYRNFLNDSRLKQVKAMRSKRG